MTSTKPYLIRAIYDWILDNQMTPHLVVDASYPGAMLPQEYVEEGRLVLNLAPSAVRGLVIGNEQIELNARFGGVARNLFIPVEAVLGVFTRENGQGMLFPEPALPSLDEDTGTPLELVPESEPPSSRPLGDSPTTTTPSDRPKAGRPTLKIVK